MRDIFLKERKILHQYIGHEREVNSSMKYIRDNHSVQLTETVSRLC